MPWEFILFGIVLMFVGKAIASTIGAVATGQPIDRGQILLFAIAMGIAIFFVLKFATAFLR